LCARGKIGVFGVPDRSFWRVPAHRQYYSWPS
jgi:hypothetical protein